MTEVAAAIIGSLIGGLVSWLIARKQPSYVTCEKIFTGWFGLRLPDVQITYRNVSLKKLYVLRLRIRNTGSQVVEKSELIIRLDKKPQVLDTAIEIIPDRIFATLADQTIIKEDGIHISLDYIYPFNLNQESIYISLLSDVEIDVADLLGIGILKDGNPWAVKYLKKPKYFIPSLGMPFTFNDRRENVYFVITVISFLGLLFSIFGYFFWRLPPGLIFVDQAVLSILLSDAFFWTVLIYTVAFIVWMFAMGLRGWLLPIPLPFFGRVIHIQFKKIRKK